MTVHDTRTRREAPAAGPAPVRPPARGFSMRPAMLVLGLGVLILAVFVTVGIVTSQSPAPVRTSAAPSAIPGTSLRAVPAADALSSIESDGQPPTNIVNAVVVPVGSVPVSNQNNSGGSGQYDSQVTLRSDDSQGALLAFFAAAMKAQGWQVFDEGPAAHDPGAVEVLGKLAGTDGYYWEMGATVPPTTFPKGAPATGETDFTIRLLQMDDPE